MAIKQRTMAQTVATTSACNSAWCTRCLIKRLTVYRPYLGRTSYAKQREPSKKSRDSRAMGGLWHSGAGDAGKHHWLQEGCATAATTSRRRGVGHCRYERPGRRRYHRATG